MQSCLIDEGKKELVTVSVHLFKHFKPPNLAVESFQLIPKPNLFMWTSIISYPCLNSY